MRKLDGFWHKFVIVMSIALVLFQLYTAIFGVFIDLVQRSIHLFFVLTLIFIKCPATKKQKNQTIVPWYDCIFTVLSLSSCLFVILYNEPMSVIGLSWFGPLGGRLDMFLSACMVLMALEASRRTVGWVFPGMAALLLFYAMQGELFTGMWGHRNMTLTAILQQLYHTTSGVWGSMIGLSAGMLAMFAIFGEILGHTGGATTFIKVGQKLTSNTTGGSGKVSLISSGLFGMVSGSSVAIVLATGTFTIPMMKKDGFNNTWAGAISAVGSTGGQIMPPIMGSGAFIMAQLLSLPYITIAKLAVVPALLYYFGAFVAIHYAAKKFRILNHTEKIRFTLWEILIIVLPLLSFVVLLSMGFTVTRGALVSTITSLVVCTASYFALERVGAVKKTGRLCFDTAINSAGSIVTIAGLMLGAQVVISMISFSGFGVKLSSLIVNLGQNNLLLCLILAMVVCLILGMGMPTTAAYVLGTAVLVPPLVNLGLKALPAHLFVFVFACLSSITPPVCSAVFVSSALAESKWWNTGWLSCALALPVFIIPYTFAYNEALLLNGDFVNVTVAVASSIFAAFFIGIAVAGFFRTNIPTAFRIILIGGGILLIVPHLLVSAISLVGCSVILFLSTKVLVARTAGK